MITGTWTVVEQPPNANVVDSCWVLCIKKNAAGEIKKYKACLLARGFTQIHSIDFYETYAPVAQLASFWLLLALTAWNDWPVDAFDFNSAYLNSVLDDNNKIIYLEQPPNYAMKDCSWYVLKLKKTLYRLKQGAKNWYDALCQVLSDLGFQRTEADHGVFYKLIGADIIVLAVHVNNCMMMESSAILINEFKAQMNKIYKLTNLGAVHWLLVIKIT